MTCNAVWLRTLGFSGLWLLLGACEGTNAKGGIGGVAGTLHTPDAGEPVSFAGEAGASAGDASSAASAMNYGANGGAEGPSDPNGHGHGGRHSNMGKAGAHNTGDSGGTSAGSDNGNEGGATVGVMIPCDVYAAYSVCRNCHIDPPVNGAPMSLLTLQDLQTEADRAYLAIETGVMPRVGTLSPEDAALILAWLDAGAQGVPKGDCPE